MDDLVKVKNVADSEYNSLFVDKLDNLILKVKIFGFHFAKLDIRQNAKIHNQFFNELFSDKFKLDDLRAIPYGAAWTQMRQNILAFYGLGTAISTVVTKDNNNLTALQKIYKRSLIIKGIFDNALQSIAQTNFNITKHISKDPKYSAFWQQLFVEHQLAKKYLLAVTEKDENFLHANPVKERSIKMRDDITLPLVILQQYALDCLRKNPNHKHKKLLKTIIKKSLAANINANQNSI
ncbi:phosphoenolpyruvate carboxylase [Francisella orientalis]|uniref:Phosphoenolpyruvate carboxylase n=1 Tax=Francisella orientalis TaxID=299583 RepID=A0ABM5U4X1_9GAMM|nr:phosphoenolpyruvate carboxylase [Francisella orientalis]AFJ42749.1 Phosphoenolpyruvate carboxylase [Francisella orientalis str. Toba 04]AHB99064.1 hypothetical protein M973_01385 [Francisella orientalis LADL 07-285A]AKN86525.1 Phosphoenolpyruvate carboxylase [Francisella orientalis FNO24]AKN84987.1 Phosphoenolpyruvate carboxylase [Francisella orientalis FNO12]AKN88063.1 Phosphoenolpyruvate carboxylase [Francisella orientalis]